MALIKEKQTNYGIIADYWKISQVLLNTLTCEIAVELQLFKDRDWRLANPQGMIESQRFSWVLPEMFAIAAETKVKDLVAMIYAKIKEPILEPLPRVSESEEIQYVNTNWFTDAVDEIEIVED
jgi:hypothetical protein